jgi:hypothetical protein
LKEYIVQSIPPQRLQSAVKNINTVLEALGQKSNNFPVSIEALQSAIEKVYSVKIYKYELFTEPKSVVGLQERWGPEGREVRVYLPKMELKNSRFYAAKEICHVVVDSRNAWSVAGTEVIKRLLNLSDVNYSPNGNSDSDQMLSEWLAEFAAAEFLYPHNQRASDRRQFVESGLTYATLSDRYQIPEFLVARVQSKEYLALCNEAWRLLGK